MRRLKSVAMLNELLRRSLECETFGTADRCGGQIARPTLSRRLKAPPQVRDGMWPHGQGRSAETLMDSGQQLPSAVTPSRGHESGPPHAAARARRQTPTFGTDRDRRRSSPSGARDQFDSKALDNGSFRSCFRSQTQQKRISHERGAKCVKRLARSERFELPTPRFVVWCSIQLSYERACIGPRDRPGWMASKTPCGRHYSLRHALATGIGFVLDASRSGLRSCGGSTVSPRPQVHLNAAHAGTPRWKCETKPRLGHSVSFVPHRGKNRNVAHDRYGERPFNVTCRPTC